MIIQSTKVFIAGQFMKAQVEVENKRIKSVLPYNKEKPFEDYGRNMIVPGFIDIHTHGAYGYSADMADSAGMAEWISKLPMEGVTSFLPTTATNRKEVIINALENIAYVKEKRPKGAEILGAHLEGPFLDDSFRGAHDLSLLKAPDIELFKEFQKASGNNIRYMTLACEHDKDFSLTKYASDNKVAVSLGHSGSSYEEALLALANGASSFTHSFNGMKGLHHREPGVAGALMTANAFAEIIADGYHVHPAVINILFKAKTNRKVILITDSLMAKGLGKGIYEYEGTKIEIDENGTARLFGTNTIAGSSLKMNIGVGLLVREAMVSVEHAVLSASFYPARLLGIERRKGQIRTGCDADFTVLDDGFNVIQTYCMGEAMIH